MAVPEFNYIYADYIVKVTRYVRSKVAETSVVDDIVSDVFIKVYQNLDKYDESKASLSSWIFTITSRTVTDYYRRRKVFSEIPEDNGAEGLMPTVLVDNTELDEGIIQEETLNQLADALEKLTERERDLIILHYYSNITLKEVAVKLGMSYANVKIVHKKALAKMKGMLAD